MVKKCKRCGEEKEEGEFRKLKREYGKSEYLNSYCKKCEAINRKIWVITKSRLEKGKRGLKDEDKM